MATEDIDTCIRVLRSVTSENRNDKKLHPVLGELFDTLKRLSSKRPKRKIEEKGDPEKGDPEKGESRSGLSLERKIRKRQWSTYAADPLTFTPVPAIASPPSYPENQSGGTFVCYICKQSIRTSHGFYDQMCPSCGEYNLKKRLQTSDLVGKTAIVTGARVKIGYQIALKLLRAGATVIATSRFPTDTCLRYTHEADFTSFKSRLKVAYLDLRSIDSINEFVSTVKEHKIDILINNAAQTLQREHTFYKQEYSLETLRCQGLIGGISEPLGQQLLISGPRCSEKETKVEVGLLDCDEYGQAVDPRPVNSWVARSTDVTTRECVDVHLINAIAPFTLIQKLTQTMTRTDGSKTHIINVTSMEGSFTKLYKSASHVHTNMAKASMNMITRTLGHVYMEKFGILINSVDTGWVDDMSPISYPKTKKIPLDIVDGAARVIDPIIQYYKDGTSYSGTFMKDYKPSTW